MKTKNNTTKVAPLSTTTISVNKALLKDVKQYCKANGYCVGRWCDIVIRTALQNVVGN